MAGAFICAALGIVPSVRHADYIGSWLQIIREDNRAILRAASVASLGQYALVCERLRLDKPAVAQFCLLYTSRCV